MRFLFVIAVAGLLLSCKEECVETSRVISAFSIRNPQLSCGPGQTMEIVEKKQGALVTCRCPAQIIVRNK